MLHMQQGQRQEEHIDLMIGICQSDNTESKNVGWFHVSQQSVLLASILILQTDTLSSPREIHFLAYLMPILKLLVSYI